MSNQRTYDRDSWQSHQISAVLDECKYANTIKRDGNNVKMRKSREKASKALHLLPVVGLVCVLLISTLVLFGMSGFRKRADDVSVLKITVPSKTKVSKYKLPSLHHENVPIILTPLNPTFI